MRMRRVVIVLSPSPAWRSVLILVLVPVHVNRHNYIVIPNHSIVIFFVQLIHLALSGIF
jgi:hypothetical protein